MKKILFISHDGKEMPGTLVRCYGFANELNKLGYEAGVLSFKDHLGARFHGPEGYKTSFPRIILELIKAVSSLIKTDRRTIFFVHKAGFHSLAPFLVHLVKGNKIIMDYDDYEYYKMPVKNVPFYLFLLSSTCCIAASKFLQKFLSMKTVKNVYYLPGGVNASEYRKEKVRKRKGVVFVWIGIIGDAFVADNVLFLIECFKEVRKYNKNETLNKE